MGSKLFRNPQALSSALAALGTLQPQAFVFLNNLDPLDSASNYYIKTPSDALHHCAVVRDRITVKGRKVIPSPCTSKVLGVDDPLPNNMLIPQVSMYVS